MTLRRQLMTSKNNIINIVKEDARIEEHFNNPANCADIILNQINNERMYEPIFSGKKDLTILDIGGNIGLFSLYAQDSANMVYVMEPTPSHCSILRDMTKDYANICVLPIALHNQDSEIDFYISNENSTMNSSVNRYGERISVNARSLASIINAIGLTHVDFIKCDIEGSEMTALTDETVGAVKDIVDNWFVEVHATDNSIPWIEALEKNRRHIAGIFERQGYKVENYRIDGLYITKESALVELNDVNGGSAITQRITEQCLNEFQGHLYGVEMGVAYGGGISRIGKKWKNRGTCWGFDTFEGHPDKEMSDRCKYSAAAGGINSFAARCMDLWYTENYFGKEKVNDHYIRAQLDREGLTNVHLVKGIVTDKTDVSFIPYLHYALIDMDFPQAQWDGYNLLKNKFVKGGYLLLHDMIPQGHIYGCWEIYQTILEEGLFELVEEAPASYMVILRKK